LDEVRAVDKTIVRVTVNVYAGGDPAAGRKLDQIIATLKPLLRGYIAMSEELDTLVERVSSIETVGDSAIVLLNELKGKLDEAIATDDKAALQALSDRLGAQTQELADAITANTPAAE
jgi:hypothetical protein